jgi:hypothetical protein
MRRPAYVCATCSEHFTRRYSATRHNLTIHNGIGEIVTYIEYLVGRNSGRYRPSHPSLYRKRRREKSIHNFAHAVAADSMGDTLPPKGLQQETLSMSIATPLSLPAASTSKPQLGGVPPYPTDQISQSIHTTNDQGTISQETMLKIQELKRLMYKYPQYHSNPGAFVKCATFYSINGDSTLLDEWLERFHTIDAISKY